MQRQLSEVQDLATEMGQDWVQTRGTGHRRVQGRRQGQGADLPAAESAHRGDSQPPKEHVH